MEFKSAIFAKYLKSLYKVNLGKTNKVHSTLIDAIFKTFVQMEDDLNQMRLELCVSTATDKWLDLWGEHFGVPRKVGEPDSKYSVRMIAEIIEPKATLNALRNATTRWVNLTYDENFQPSEIEISEPWKDLLVTSQRGALSYLARLPDSEYWTHGVVDIAIPDSSEMSAELIAYLNTVKAAGVQIAWHTTMSWEILVGYFTQDSIKIAIEKLYNIWVKREYNVVDGMRTSCEWVSTDESYNTPVSVRGYLSGRKLSHFDAIVSRDFEPFVLPTHIVQCSPIVNMEDLAFFSGVPLEELTVQQVVELELMSDRQIPNVENTGLLFEEEVKQFLFTDVSGIKDELGDSSVEDLNKNQFKEKSVSQIIGMFEKDADGLSNFLKTWRKPNYFNKPLNSNPLSIFAGPLKILIETDTN